MVKPDEVVFLNRDESVRLRAEELGLPEDIEREIDELLGKPWRHDEQERSYMLASARADRWNERGEGVDGLSRRPLTAADLKAKAARLVDEDKARAIVASYRSAGWTVERRFERSLSFEGHGRVVVGVGQRTCEVDGRTMRLGSFHESEGEYEILLVFHRPEEPE